MPGLASRRANQRSSTITLIPHSARPRLDRRAGRVIRFPVLQTRRRNFR